jgi:hypothetical protein
LHGFAKRSLNLPKRRRVIRYIFLAYYLVEKSKAKKDVASTAHPNPVTQRTIAKKEEIW